MATELDQVVQAAGRVSKNSSDFDLNPEVTMPPNMKLRPAAVLIPLLETPAGLCLILTKRAATLRHHPGQVAFPGGKVDQTDAGPKAAALREAEEEIGLLRENVEVLATLPTHQTVTGYSITPVIGRVIAAFDPKPEPGEVAEVFQVPFRSVGKPENFLVQSRVWRAKRRYYYTVPHGPYYIWGATARILRALAEGMRA